MDGTYVTIKFSELMQIVQGYDLSTHAAPTQRGAGLLCKHWRGPCSGAIPFSHCISTDACNCNKLKLTFKTIPVLSWYVN